MIVSLSPTLATNRFQLLGRWLLVPFQGVFVFLVVSARRSEFANPSVRMAVIAISARFLGVFEFAHSKWHRHDDGKGYQ